MLLKVLASSSAGNCYIFENKTEALIVEGGVKMGEVKKALNYDVSKVCGCIVTHEHLDHSKYIADYAKAGITVLALQPVLERAGISEHHRSKILAGGAGYLVGKFKVFAFPVSHDVPCLGFVITHPDMGKVLFITDTFSCEYRFDNLSTIMIEANYAHDLVQKRIDEGKVSPSVRKRLRFSHMEIETTKEVILKHNITSVSKIILLHLSSENSNAVRFQSTITGATGKPVYVADKGMELTIGSTPY